MDEGARADRAPLWMAGAMIAAFDESEGRLLRQLFAYSVENPLSLRTVDLSILASDPGPTDAITDAPMPEGGIMDVISRITVFPERERGSLDLVDRVFAVMLVGYYHGFFTAVQRACLPVGEDAMATADLYPGLEEACTRYCLLEASFVAMPAQSRLAPLRGQKALVHETLDLFQRAMQRSASQGYRTGALAADALRGGIASKLAGPLGVGEIPPDDARQNEAVGAWLARFGWDDLQREILRHMSAGFSARLERMARFPDLVGLPRACGDWTEAGDDYMADVLVAIAKAGIRAGMRMRLQLATTRPTPPSDTEVRLTYRVSRSIALLARQWSSWHPAPSSELRLRQAGENIIAPTFATGAALGHMIAEELDSQVLPKVEYYGN